MGEVQRAEFALPCDMGRPYVALAGLMYQPDHLPGQFFDGRIPYPPDKKEFNPPRPIKRAKTPPRGHLPQLFTIKHEKTRQKSCKTARFYHFYLDD